MSNKFAIEGLPAGLAAAPEDALAKSHAPPYRPGWIDCLTGWVRRLPGPSWLYYLGLWAALFGLVTAVKWLDGTYPPGRLDVRHALFCAYGVWCLVLVHHLDWEGARVMAEARPALNVDEAQYARLTYGLTTTPARGALVASAVSIAVFSAVAAAFLPTFRELAAVARSPLSTVVDIGIVNTLNFWAFGGLVYHTLHQLRTVNRIYTHHARIDILQSRPLHAFSRLTIKTALGFVIVPYLTVLVGPQVARNPLVVAVLVLNAGLAAVTFGLPLAGIHDRLRESKEEHELEIDRRVKATSAELHRRIDAGEFAGMDDMNKAIASLALEYEALDRMPTWPWSPGTLRALVSALTLPVAVWIVQEILRLWLGF